MNSVSRGCVFHQYPAGCIQVQRIAGERERRRREAEPETAVLGMDLIVP